jgi:hypothetical protein
MDQLLRTHDVAANEGRCMKLVPASGAASRMFKELLAFRSNVAEFGSTDLDQAPADTEFVSEFMGSLHRFAFYEELLQALEPVEAELTPARVIDALLFEPGLGYASLPKGLLTFHRYQTETRTAFEEHLTESANLVADAQNVCRLHLTVSPEHRGGFIELLERGRPKYEARLGVRFAVTFSAQNPSTDTISIDTSGSLARDHAGRLLFRPSGHGALLTNLSDLKADIVLLKNVDNVSVEALASSTIRWGRLLSGRLLQAQRAAFTLLRRLENLDDANAPIAACGFLEGVLHRNVVNPAVRADRSWLGEQLDRPLRVCGMVANSGEPGGGPFWVRDGSGELSLQIVESAQVDTDNPAQLTILKESTHFNPVFMACGVQDYRGVPHDLNRFVDASAVIIGVKSFEGRDLMTLERPGLWNGGMARWNTLFVAVPADVFTPCKTVMDLLRPQHQPQ